MGKKKKHKKQQFKYATPTQPASPAQGADKPVTATKSAQPVSTISTPMPAHLAQSAGDLKRVLVMSGFFVGLQLVLWYILNHTSFGPAIYNLIKV
jgi:hypothetical protein